MSGSEEPRSKLPLKRRTMEQKTCKRLIKHQRRSLTLTVQFILGERRLAQVSDAVGSWSLQKQNAGLSQSPAGAADNIGANFKPKR